MKGSYLAKKNYNFKILFQVTLKKSYQSINLREHKYIIKIYTISQFTLLFSRKYNVLYVSRAIAVRTALHISIGSINISDATIIFFYQVSA